MCVNKYISIIKYKYVYNVFLFNLLLSLFYFLICIVCTYIFICHIFDLAGEGCSSIGNLGLADVSPLRAVGSRYRPCGFRCVSHRE